MAGRHVRIDQKEKIVFTGRDEVRFKSRGEVVAHLARAADAKLRADGVDRTDEAAVRKNLSECVLATRVTAAWMEVHMGIPAYEQWPREDLEIPAFERGDAEAEWVADAKWEEEEGNDAV